MKRYLLHVRDPGVVSLENDFMRLALFRFIKPLSIAFGVRFGDNDCQIILICVVCVSLCFGHVLNVLLTFGPRFDSQSFLQESVGKCQNLCLLQAGEGRL